MKIKKKFLHDFKTYEKYFEEQSAKLIKPQKENIIDKENFDRRLEGDLLTRDLVNTPTNDMNLVDSPNILYM